MRIDKVTKKIFLCLMWLIEGIVVGFGAILPGISGGTLLVAFGMYRPAIEVITNIKEGLKKHGFMLCVFALGGAIGFVGLAGLAAYLMERNTELVTCAFVGFILGTLPELWQDAGTQGRSGKSYISLIVGFVAMLGILMLLKTKLSVSISADFIGFLICGLLWGLSFIVPGLSSSSLLLFFGLYEPMLEGIAKLNMLVIIPMGIGFLACALCLSKAVSWLYEKFYTIISHAILGIVAATAVMVTPSFENSASSAFLNITLIIGGAITSYIFTLICGKLRQDNDA